MRPASVRCAALLAALISVQLLRPSYAPSWAIANSTVSRPVGTAGPSGRRSQGFAESADGEASGWVWGGWGADSAGTLGRLNDMWKITWPAWKNGSTSSALASEAQWDWVPQAGRDASMGVQVNMVGRFGALGVAGADLVPGARDGHVLWSDYLGNVWLFGGTGVTAAEETTT
eukprot:COSAG03_NODE_8823_length_768_cov_1.303438_1_plen_172_part_10